MNDMRNNSLVAFLKAKATNVKFADQVCSSSGASAVENHVILVDALRWTSGTDVGVWLFSGRHGRSESRQDEIA